MDLKDLGLDPAALMELVAENVANALIHTSGEDFEGRIRDLVKERVGLEIGVLFDRHIAGRVERFVDELVLQETDRWGDAKEGKPPLSLKEYMVERADAYMREQVNSEGKNQDENGRAYNFTGEGSRITHLVDKHLRGHIGTAVTDALKNVNSQLAEGIATTVKIQLKKTLDKMKIEVKT